MGETCRIACSAQLTASHRDLIMDEGLHEHTWTFWAWFERGDLRSHRAALVTLLAPYQGTELPPELWAGEDMCAHLLAVFGNGDCLGVTVERPGFRGEVWL